MGGRITAQAITGYCLVAFGEFPFTGAWWWDLVCWKLHHGRVLEWIMPAMIKCSAMIGSWTEATEKADSELHSFSYWVIMTWAMERTNSEVHSFSHWAIMTQATERSVRCIRSPTELSWPGPRRDQWDAFIPLLSYVSMAVSSCNCNSRRIAFSSTLLSEQRICVWHGCQFLCYCLSYRTAYQRWLTLVWLIMGHFGFLID